MLRLSSLALAFWLAASPALAARAPVRARPAPGPARTIPALGPASIPRLPLPSAEASIAAIPDHAPAEPGVSYDYAKMFELSRRLLTRPEVRKFLREVFAEELKISEEMQKEHNLPDRIKSLSESQFMLLLQHNPESFPMLERYAKEMEKDDKKEEPDPELRERWKKRFHELVEQPRVAEVFKKFNDPLTPMRLDTADGSPGYRNARVYANHASIRDGKELPPADLKAVLIDFINGAEKELMFNVFDFDLEDVADALIARAKAGVKITGGIDKKTIEHRPQVKAVFDKLNAQKNITMRAVDSVGLNHQKIVIRDQSDPAKAGALFSSGNFTQSCLGPEGDLVGVPAEKRPKNSVPNANHVMVVDSYLLAQLTANNLIKTLVMGLRGAEYPLGGAYRIVGENPDKKDPEQAPWMIVAFSPRGGLGDINRDMTRRLVRDTRGPLRLMQFAFSSNAVRDAIIERARREKAEGGQLDLKTVGDTPFAVRPWSVFLELAGYALLENETGKRYVEAAENALRRILGKRAYEALRRNVRAAPLAYRTHKYRADDGSVLDYNAKIHHKVVLSGPYAVLGTSFNFSEAANNNQEQFLVTSDPALVAAMYAAFDGLFAQTSRSLVDEVLRRNSFLAQPNAEDDLQIGSKYKHVDEEASRSRKK